MNTPPTYAPSPWRAGWYRITRLCSCLFRRKPRFDVNQALKDQKWQDLKHGKEQGLGCCPEHPDEPPMMKIRPSDYRCPICWNADFFHTLDAGPITDPHHLQIVIPTQRPQQVYLQARKEGAGTHTAALAAIPRWLMEVYQTSKEKERNG